MIFELAMKLMTRCIGVFVCLFVAFSVTASSHFPSCQLHHCAVVVDAGSTGSRIHLYAYDFDSNSNPIQINELWSKKLKPGLSTIEPQQKVIDAYLTALFDQAPVQNAPVYFYATGGMRLLSYPSQQLYYQLLHEWFEKQTQWTLIEAKTITGVEEGVYGWLMMNYELGTLSSSDKPLVGLMDMGGASVQITYPVQDIDMINQQDLVQLDLYGRHFSLFAHSFLGLGATEVSHQFLDAESCFPEGYPLPNGLAGHGDEKTCQPDVANLIDKVHHVNRVVKPVLAANPVSTWYTIGGLSYMAKKEPFYFEKNQMTTASLLSQADDKVCHQPWSDLKTQYATNDSIFNDCLTASYFYALMVDGYGLKTNEVVNYMPENQERDWTLGVVLSNPKMMAQ